MNIEILNIPNFYSTYYILGLSMGNKILYKDDEEFAKYNGRPVIVFKYNHKIFVIDNNDPVGIDSSLYNICSLYFVTNLLKENHEYEKQKLLPLFPHYPVNCLGLYIKIFNEQLIKKLGVKETIRQLKAISIRPKYKSYKLIKRKDNFVFFISRIWKKERETNEIRSKFIQACLDEERINFKGGLASRSDGNNFGFENIVTYKSYSPKKFNYLSRKSKFTFNNPAVLGAVSWRFAEYLNLGLFIISSPFKVTFPIEFEDAVNIHFIPSNLDFKSAINRILSDEKYRCNVERNTKAYFENYCTPKSQANYIMKFCRQETRFI